MSCDRIDEKFRAFGWETLTVDGHNIEQIIEVLDKADTVEENPAIVADGKRQGSLLRRR